MAIGRSIVSATFVAAAVIVSAPARAQQTATPSLLTGPLSWTPVFQLREAGVDTNVFNAGTNPRQDVTAGLGAGVDGDLHLPAVQLVMHGASEYEYFERYKSQAGLNSNVTAKATFPLSYFQPSVYGAFLHAKDRSINDEFGIRALHNDHRYGVGLDIGIGQHMAVVADANRAFTEFAKGSQFAGVELAERLNRRSTTATAGMRVTLTPFTSITVDGGYGLDEFAERPLANTRNMRANVGFRFSPDAVISGQASVGYHRMNPQFTQSAVAQNFSGLTSAVALSYLLAGVTRLGVSFTRDTNYSITSTWPYYVTTAGGLDITQTLPGPFMLNVHGTREQLAYPATALSSGHTDSIQLLGGGLQISASANARIALNYDYLNRRSPVEGNLNYDRRHIYTTVTYGF